MSNIIKGIRNLKGYTQEEVAKALGITIRTYWKKEGNPGNFTVAELTKMAGLFGVEEEIFFKEKVTVIATE